MNKKTRKTLQASLATITEIISAIKEAREEEDAQFNPLIEKATDDEVVKMQIRLNSLQLIEEYLEEVAVALGEEMSEVVL